MDILNANKLATMALSTFASVFIAVFLLDYLKSLLKGMYESFAIEIKALVCLPANISLYRIARLIYILGILHLTSEAHIHIRAVSSVSDLFVYIALSAIAVPSICFLFFLWILLIWQLMDAIYDCFLYLGGIPYHLYRKHHSFGLYQFFMLLEWLLFFALLLSSIFTVCSAI